MLRSRATTTAQREQDGRREAAAGLHAGVLVGRFGGYARIATPVATSAAVVQPSQSSEAERRDRAPL
ncbi:MAG: hypothetical protein IPN32_15075 [Deltaproteobacteria bacterium]|nr:hypothetical protein [Deltaproteobacteria bacterium]